MWEAGEESSNFLSDRSHSLTDGKPSVTGSAERCHPLNSDKLLSYLVRDESPRAGSSAYNVCK